MPKLKTVKGVKDRLKMTGRGKLLGFRAGRRHLLSGKRAKIKRQLRRPQTLSPVEARQVRTLIPYGEGGKRWRK
jgi:large subunit ribosomal protein L35